MKVGHQETMVWARSLARIKASASGADNPGFKSQRARQHLTIFGSVC